MKKDTFETINELIKIKSEHLTEFSDVHEYEKWLLHIEKIVDSSILLYHNSFYQQAIFLIITAFEEITKAEICLYRGLSEKKEVVKRNKDGLFNHKTKHLTIANEITFSYLKSENKFGKFKIKEVYDNLKTGKFIEIRENALYFKNIEGKCIISNDYITEESTKL